jgi:hypothetical protein
VTPWSRKPPVVQHLVHPSDQAKRRNTAGQGRCSRWSRTRACGKLGWSKPWSRKNTPSDLRRRGNTAGHRVASLVHPSDLRWSNPLGTLDQNPLVQHPQTCRSEHLVHGPPPYGGGSLLDHPPRGGALVQRLVQNSGPETVPRLAPDDDREHHAGRHGCSVCGKETG